MHAVDQELVVEVRTGGVAGGADVTDHVALGNGFAAARLAREAGQVEILGAETVAVFEEDVVAVRAVAPGDLDRPVPGGQHRRAHRGGVVDAAMRHGPFEQRVAALEVEVRADARELHRRAQETLAHRLALGAVELGAPGAVHVADGPVAITLVDEFGREYVAELDRLAVVAALLEDDVEAVARTDVEDEVDVPAEDVRERERHAVVQADALTGVEQRMLDHGLPVHRDEVRCLDDLAGYETVVHALELEPLEARGGVREAQQLALGTLDEGEFVAGVQARQPLGQRTAVEDALQLPGGDPAALEDDGQVVSGTDALRLARTRRNGRRRKVRSRFRGESGGPDREGASRRRPRPGSYRW